MAWYLPAAQICVTETLMVFASYVKCDEGGLFQMLK